MKMEGIELYPHNQKAYDNLCAMLRDSNRACVVQPTGTGKFVIIAKMAQDNPGKNFLLLGTNDYMYIDQMANLSDIAPGFTPKNLQFMTYATAMAKARCGDEIPRCDVIVADEFHHCGAPEWGKGVQYVVENNPDAKIVGFSATPIRYSDKGRNMADEMFVGNIASSMELEEAWLDGVLPMPKYVIALYDAPKELGELKVSIEKVREKKKYSKFVKKYEELRRSLQDADGIDRIIAKHLRKRDGKVIVFCPNRRIPDFTKGNQVTPVICLETGKRFETQSQAEIEIGISRGSICRALNTGKTAKGYHWIRESEYSEEKAAAARAESAPYRVVCLETGTRYKTYADAGRDLGVEEGNIQQAVKSKSHYARGYHFVNSDEYSTLAKGEIENILKRDGRSRTVVCVETGKRYESIKAASGEYGDRLGSARSRIGLCCKNPYLTFDGKHWCYPDDLESRIDNAEEYTVPRKTAVQCLETGKMYESIADASRDTGINHNSIRSVARGDRHKAGGYTWEYVNPAPDKRDNRGCNQPTAKKVRCAETGNQFVSLSDAARAVGLRNGASVRRAIDRGGTAGGYHWEYLDEKKEVSTDDHHQADGRAE